MHTYTTIGQQNNVLISEMRLITRKYGRYIKYSCINTLEEQCTWYELYIHGHECNLAMVCDSTLITANRPGIYNRAWWKSEMCMKSTHPLEYCFHAHECRYTSSHCLHSTSLHHLLTLAAKRRRSVTAIVRRFLSVRPSICPSVHPSVRPSVRTLPVLTGKGR